MTAKPDFVKPNQDELEELFGSKLHSMQELIESGSKLRKLNIRYVVISLEADGALLICDDGSSYRLSEIARAVSVPLVLHGASGVPDELVKKAISQGICKVNYATELRIAYSEGVKEVLCQAPDTIDPQKYGAVGRYIK